MDFKEEKALMEKMGKARYDSLDDAARKQIDGGKAADAQFAAIYARAEDAEHAWTRYLLSLSESEHDALCSDSAKYMAVSGLFRSAVEDPETMERYASMTPDELAQIVAGNDAAALAKMDDAEFAKTVADLKTAAPGRLAAALASLKKLRQET